MRGKKTRKTISADTALQVTPAPFNESSAMLTETPPAALTLWHQEPEDADQIVTLLTAADARFEVLPTLEDVDRHLQSTPDAHVALVYRLPQTVISDRMGDGQSPEASLKMCNEDLSAMLGLVRRYRRRLTLFASQQVFQFPRAFLARFNLSATDLPELQYPVTAANAVLDLLAAEALRQDLTTRSLAEELEASAIALDEEGPPEPSLDLAFSQYSQLQDRTRTSAIGLEEAELLKSALTESRTELEAQAHEAVTLQEQLAALSEAKRQLETRIEAATTELDAHTAAVAERDHRIVALEESLAESQRVERETELLRAHLVEQLADGESAQEAVAARDHRILALEESLAESRRLEREVELLRAQMAEQLADGESTQEAVAARDHRIIALEESLAESRRLEREVELLRAQMAEQLADGESAQEAGAERDHRILALEESLAASQQLEREVELLRAQMAEQLADGESAQEAVAERDRRIVALEESLAASRRLEREVELLRAQMIEQLADSEAAHETIGTLNARLAALSDEKTTALKRVAHLESLAETHATTAARYEKQIYQLSQGLDSYGIQVGALEAEKTALTASMQKVREALVAAERTVKEQAVRLTGMTSERRVAADQIAHLGRMLEFHKSRLETSETERRALDDNLVETRASLSHMEAENAQLRGGQSELEQEVARLGAEMSQLALEMAASRAELDAIKAAKFYRWLLPLRKLYAAARGKSV